MEYIDVTWNHTFDSEPVRLVSELDSQRFETRKLEFFRSGEVGYATPDGASLNTELGTVAVPPLEEINSDPQFQGRQIGQAEFELLWAKNVPTS